MSARLSRWLLLVVVAVALVSCGDGVDDEDDDRSELPNPASVFCEEQGGTVEIVTDSSGNESGICHLPDGTQIDEWQYYRQATETTGAGLANPASVFCVEQGGTVEIVTDSAGNQSGICNLPDGTSIDEWEYFRSHSGAD